MKQKINILLLLCVFLFGCSKSDVNTELFEQYLKDVFNIPIPEKKKAFIIMNTHSCPGCVGSLISQIKPIINNNNYTYIFAIDNNKIPRFLNEFKDNKNVLFDFGMSFFEINISPFSDCIIYTNNKKIVKILKFDNSDFLKKLSSIDSLMNHN